MDFMQGLVVNFRSQGPPTSSPHLFFARPRAKVNVIVKHDFIRYDASIKIVENLARFARPAVPGITKAVFYSQ